MTNLLLFDLLSEHVQVCASALMAQYATQLYPTTPSFTLETYPVMAYPVSLP